MRAASLAAGGVILAAFGLSLGSGTASAATLDCSARGQDQTIVDGSSACRAVADPSSYAISHVEGDGVASPIRETVAGRRASDSSAALLQRSRAVGCLPPSRTARVRSHSVAPTPHHLPSCSVGLVAERQWVTRTSGRSAQVVPPLFSISPQVRDVSATALRRGSPREGTPALSLLRDSGHNGVKLLPPIG